MAIPIAPGGATVRDEVELLDLPSITAVVTVYHGLPPITMLSARSTGQMSRYAEDHGYLVQGPGRDHFVSRDDQNITVLELQLPITLAPPPDGNTAADNFASPPVGQTLHCAMLAGWAFR